MRAHGPQNKLLIVQPFSSGHHMSLYVRMAVLAGRKLGFELGLLTYESSSGHEAFKSVVSEFGDGLAIHLMPDPQPSGRRGRVKIIKEQFALYNAIDRAVEAMGQNCYGKVWLANLEQIDIAFALRGSPFGDAAVYGLHMTLDFHRPMVGTSRLVKNASAKMAAFAFLLRREKLKRVALIDESYFLSKNVMRWWIEPIDKVSFVPDVGMLRDIGSAESTLRSTLGIEPDRFVILVYGGITVRKKVSDLLAALADARLKHCALVLAGRIDESVQDELATDAARKMRAEHRLFEINRFVDTNLESLLFKMADLVSVLYTRDFSGSSGVMYQAAAAGKPFLSDHSGVIGWVCRRSGAGITVNGDNRENIVRALLEVSEKPEVYRAMAERAVRLARLHSEEAHVIALVQALQSG